MALLLVGILLFVPLIGLSVVRIYKGVMLDRGCTGYLKLAADANSVSLAKERLDKALDYIEDNRMTEGYTSVLWNTPEQNVGEWYKNLKETQKNLKEHPVDATEADTSTALVKLRETLLDHGDHGDFVTIPSGLAVFPNNIAWWLGWWLVAIFAASGVGCIIWFLSRL